MDKKNTEKEKQHYFPLLLCSLIFFGAIYSLSFVAYIAVNWQSSVNLTTQLDLNQFNTVELTTDIILCLSISILSFLSSISLFLRKNYPTTILLFATTLCGFIILSIALIPRPLLGGTFPAGQIFGVTITLLSLTNIFFSLHEKKIRFTGKTML